MNANYSNQDQVPSDVHGIPHIRLDGQVAIVTGAGRGLGRSHALELARRGACVVVNDFNVVGDGSQNTLSAADQVVNEIRSLGGEAFASNASVTDAQAVKQMIDDTMGKWGRIDILVNNAGFLRDKSFSKITIEDFQAIIDVHLMGAVRCTKAVWDIMKTQRYGRVVMTTSSSGLFGNFGQSNYGAAKMGLVGLMQTLAIEGEKYNIYVNCLAPSAATRMTEEIFSSEDLGLLTPESVSPGMIYLVSPNAPSKTILCAGAGSFACSNVTLTAGVHVGQNAMAAEILAASSMHLVDRNNEIVPSTGFQQAKQEMLQARAARESVCVEIKAPRQ
jgi:NAD(P)-dependent dehydrogenase (short-subunit alcohol dehydrogenase family)